MLFNLYLLKRNNMFWKLFDQLTTSKWNYWFGFIFDGIFVFVFAYYASTLSGFSVGMSILAFVLGFLSFSFVEYFFHAWLFHGTMRVFVKGHAGHHADPFKYDSLPFFTGTLVGVILFSGAALVVTPSGAWMAGSGFLLGYIVYGLTHHALHRIEKPRGYFKFLVELHDIHHARPKLNHGVTSPFWDIVFRTYTRT